MDLEVDWRMVFDEVNAVREEEVARRQLQQLVRSVVCLAIVPTATEPTLLAMASESLSI